MEKSNLNKYNNKRGKILIKGIIPSLVGIFTPKKKNRIIFNSTLNESYDFNTKYLFEYFIKNHPEYEVKYVINIENKRQALNQQFGIKNNYFIETSSYKGMWYALRAKTWITSGFETPVGGFFLRANRFVYLLGHGVMIKACVFMEKQLPWYKKLYYQIIKYNFSHYLVTSRALIKTKALTYKCRKEQLVIAGEPATDCVFKPNTNIIIKTFGSDVNKDINIIYSPTWRQSGKQQLFPFDDMNWEDLAIFLNENKINIFLRLHPSFEENLDFYTNKSQRIKIINTSVIEDINEVIGFFDLIITDYSSIHVGYLLLKKPVLFLPYDIDEYERKVGFTMPFKQFSPGPMPNSYHLFKTEIMSLIGDSNYFLDERVKVSAILNDFKADNAKMNAEFILNELSK